MKTQVKRKFLNAISAKNNKKICTPKLIFGKWMKWTDETKHDFYKYPGIYLICFDSKNASSLIGKKPNFEDSNIHYIGESHSKNGLKIRLNQFEQAVENYYGHTGGHKIYWERAYRNRDNYWQKQTAFSVLPIEYNGDYSKKDKVVLKTITQYLETKALMQFYKKFSRLPEYNQPIKYREKTRIEKPKVFKEFK